MRVADASKYYGISTLTHNVLLGAAKITVDSIFTQLVPSAQVETPIVDINAAGQDVSLVASNSSVITVAKSFTVNSSQGLYIGSAILPKTLTFTLFGSAIKDSGSELKNTSGVVIGTIDYQNGLINWNSNAGTGSTTTTFSFTPAALPTKPQSTRLLRVTAENRGYNWIASLLPIPSPATLIVSYVAQGKVYTLRDNGAGQLKGSDNAFGSGTISYETGTMVLTTGEMPDVDTGILIAWGNNLSVFERSSMPFSKAYIDLNFDSDAIIAGSLTVKWLLNGVEKTATETGTGQFTGDATGTIDYANGTAKLMPKLLPNGGTTFNITGSKGEKKTTDISVTPSSGVMEFDIPGTNPLTPNSVTLGVPVVSADSKSGYVQLYDRNVDGVTGNGELTLNVPISHAYTSGQTFVSSAMMLGDIQARVHNIFSQNSWQSNWLDEREGSAISAQYNSALFPIEITNQGALQERWALIFTAPTVYRLVGEKSGVIGEGISISSDYSPLNPITNAPYFKIKAAGFGAGWAAGNVIRLNTAGATYPFWVARTVKQGQSLVVDDSFQIQARCGVDRV